MKKGLRRDLMWMTFPVLFIGAGVWWRLQAPREERPPEDVTRGRPRVVVGKWRELKPSPFDIYRGYERKFEVSLWSAGQLPPIIPTRAKRSLALYRQINFSYPELSVLYQRGNTWKKLRSTFDKPAVLTEFSPVSKTLGERLVVPLLIRLPPKDATAGARLRGHLALNVYDYEQFKTGPTLSDEIIGSHDLVSPPVDRVLSLAGRTLQTKAVSRRTPLRLDSFQLPKFSASPGTSFDITVRCDDPVLLKTPFPINLYHARLLDTKGKEIAKCGSYTNSIEDGVVKVAPFFNVTLTTSKKFRDGVVFQGVLSVNGCWPLEINTVIPSSSTPVAKPSPLPFER